MQPGNRQLDFAEHLVIELDLEDRPAAFGPDVHRQQSRVARMNAVPDDLRGARRRETVRARIVGTEHDGARWRRELFERAVDVREIGVDVEMIRLDVRDDGDGRREREERSVVLVGLDDEQSIRAIAKVPAPAANATADDAGGLERRPPASASVVMTVVVVFPCVPAMATRSPPLTASPSASARRITGIPRSRAR